jgi:hypothetical protein
MPIKTFGRDPRGGEDTATEVKKAIEMNRTPCTGHRRRQAWTLAVALGLAALAPPLAAAEPELLIELNKLEDTEQGCRSLFLFDNATGHELNRFRVDLILFDQEGVYAKQLLLDMAPLSEDKKVLTSFLLADQPCASIGSILVNDLPLCENGSGAELDCVPLLKVESRTDVPLEK